MSYSLIRIIHTGVLLLFLALVQFPVTCAAAPIQVASLSDEDFQVKLLSIVRAESLRDYEKAISLVSQLMAQELSTDQEDKLNSILADCYLNTNRLEDAKTVAGILKGSKNQVYRAYGLYIEGRLGLFRKTYREAVAKFRQAITLHEDENTFYVWLAQANLAYTQEALQGTGLSEAQKKTLLDSFKSTVEEVKNHLMKNNYPAQAYEIAYISYSQLDIEPQATQNLIEYVTLNPSIESLKELYTIFYTNKDYLSNIAMLDSFTDTDFANQPEFLYMQGASLVAYGYRLMDSTLAYIEVAGIEGIPATYKADSYLVWIDEGLSKYNAILENKKVTPQVYQQVLREGLSVYLNLKQTNKAVTLVHANKNIETDYPDLMRIFAVTSFYAGEDKAGFEYMDKAIDLATKQNDKIALSYIYDSLSAYYSYHGNYKMAKDFSDKAIALDNRDDMVRLRYNRFFTYKKLPAGIDQAREIRMEIIAGYAGNKDLTRDERAMISLMLADDAIESGKYDDGLEYARYAQNLAPTVADSYYYAALALYKKKDYKMALNWVKRAEYYEEADPQYIYLEQLIYEGMYNKKGASDAAKRIKAKAPGFNQNL